MKAFTLLVKILLGLVVLVVVVLGIVVATVDPNDYKSEITAAVKEQTGRELSIDNMSLSVFPSISIDLENTSLSNAQGFSEQPFVDIKKVSVGAALWPLLSQKLVVDTLTLHGLSLNLQKNKQGVTNWDDLSKTNEVDTKAEIQDEAGEDPLAKLAALNFGGLDIKDGTIHWQDAQNQQNILLENVSVSSGAITFDEFFALNIAAKANIDQPNITSQVSIDLEAMLSQTGHYEVRNVSLNNTTTGQALPVKSVETNIQLPSFVLQKNTLNLPELQIDFDVMGKDDFAFKTVSGQLNLAELTGLLSEQRFKVASFSVDAALTGDSLPNQQANLALNTQANLDLQKQTAQLNNLTFDALGLEAQAEVSAQQIIDNAQVQAKLSTTPTNLRALLTQLKIELPAMSDQNTLTKMVSSLEVAFNSKNEEVELNNLKVSLDDSTLTGQASVQNFAQPKVRYELALDTIDVNRYLPPKAASTDNESSTDKEAVIELPTAMLRKLAIDGTLKVGTLTYAKLAPKNIIITTRAKQGLIKVKPIKADLFDTTINASASLDVRGQTPKYNLSTQAKQLPIGDVLMAVADTDRLTGTGAIDADISTAGDRVSQFKEQLNGRLAMNLKDGAVKGFNLAKMIRQAKAKLGGNTASANASTETKTDFSSLIAQFTIKDGLVNTEKLNAQAPFMRIDGKGQINLPKENLDMLVKTKIVGTSKGQGGPELTDLNGVTIPVKLQGNYTSPKISLDMESLVKSQAKAKIEEKKAEVVDEVKEKAQEKLKNLIPKGLGF